MVSENYIAQRIRELRKGAGMDVDTVGRGVGRSGKTVSAWETGRNVPSADMLISICKFFGVDIDYFYPPEVTSSGSRNEMLASDERELIALYRNMESGKRQTILETARAFSALSEKDGCFCEADSLVVAVDAVRPEKWSS